MANWNCNYIYGVPPTQDYQEYGVYGGTIDTAPVPLEYVGPIYSVLYTGVTSYEFNGTTYYNYNLYEIPVFSSSDYDSMSSDLRFSYALSNTSYSHSFSTSISYNTSNNNSYTVENHGLFTDTINSSYNSFPSLDENDSTNTENISCPDTQGENHTDLKDEDSNSEIVIESHNTPAFTTEVVVNNSVEYSVLEQDTTVSEIDNDEDYEEYLLIYEDREILNWSAEIEDFDMKESNKAKYEESKISDWSVEIEDDDMKESEKVIYEESETSDWSVEIEDDDMKESEINIYEESKISDYSVETEDGDMKESENVIYKESKIADWSVETEYDDMKESEKDSYEESKILDWSVEIEDDLIESEKVLYEEYVHQSLFTEETTVLDWSVEVPDNDVETDVEDDFNKVNSSTVSDIVQNYSKADIKYLKEKLYIEALSGHLYLKESVPVVDVLPVIEEESQSVEEDDTLECVVYDLKGKKENIPDGTEKNIESDVTFDTCEKFIENHATESAVVFEEMKENYLNLIENDINLIENDINLIENDIEYRQPCCCNGGALLKPGEEVIKDEVISNQADRNLIMNATGHVSPDTSPHGEYYSKSNGVKIMKNGENASRKRSKKKFDGFRKWIGNLFCCVRKKNSSDSFD